MDETAQIQLQNAMLIERLECSKKMENDFLKKMQCLKEKLDKGKIQEENRVKIKEDEWRAKELQYAQGIEYAVQRFNNFGKSCIQNRLET